MKVLVTCPPMLGQFERFLPRFADVGWDAVPAKVVQTLSQDELCELLPEFDGWIIGDDPATRRVFEAGKSGRLKAAVKWGIGVDNVDFQACKDLEIPIINTPLMFGAEVADLALSYVLALARETFPIDRGIRAGAWPKPSGISLAGRTIGVVGLGDIGANLVKRVQACGMNVIGWDPGIDASRAPEGVSLRSWPQGVAEVDFLAFTCALNAKNFHMLSQEVLAGAKDGVRVVNVARGGLIDQSALVDSLRTGKVHSAALDVFEQEPLPMDSFLREHPLCILGSHNGSNTKDAVVRASLRAIELLDGFLKGKK